VGTFKNNQKGFGAIEVLMVLGIVILIGAAGWLVYKNQNKAHTQNKTAKTLQQDLKGQVLSGSAPNPSQYNGWQSFCSSYGGLCLKYPASWKITQATYPPGTEPNGQEVDTITSPSGNVKVVYMPSAQVSGDRQVETITVASATKTDVSDLGVFQLINALSPSQFAVENFVTLTTASHALNSTDSPFTQGATIANASEPPYHQFTNPQRPEDIGQQLLVVTNASGDPAGNSFASSAAAQAWLNSAEVQTASRILGSVTYSP
jgi:type II secretory pathway pseudopilin PulG